MTFEIISWKRSNKILTFVDYLYNIENKHINVLRCRFRNISYRGFLVLWEVKQKTNRVDHNHSANAIAADKLRIKDLIKQKTLKK